MRKPKIENQSDELPDSLWAALNLPAPRSSDDPDAPAVDRTLLLQLVRRQMPRGQARAVYRLIHAFESWKKAYAEIVIEEFPRGRAPR